MRRLALLIIVAVLAGGAVGYFARNSEVDSAHAATTKSRAETKTAKADAQEAHDDADAVRSDLTSAEDRLDACAQAIADLRNDIIALLNAASSAVNGEYYSVVDTLDTIDLATSTDEQDCKGNGGFNS